jgi:hypothetical protein
MARRGCRAGSRSGQGEALLVAGKRDVEAFGLLEQLSVAQQMAVQGRVLEEADYGELALCRGPQHMIRSQHTRSSFSRT